MASSGVFALARNLISRPRLRAPKEVSGLVKIKRIYCKGYSYFITNVTYDRRPILLDNVDLLWKSIDSIHNRIDFDLMAWVILPEHFHFLIDIKEANISDVLQRIKLSFSNNYRQIYGFDYGKVWQNGFWDHIIRDEPDLNNHLNYIHFNPVKHGLINRPFDYEQSSMRKYKDNYAEDWGVIEAPEFEGKFGE